uniref:Integrase core domain-containing protein n=1 Tax=Paramormyrops kingsleyae TaxID=1676925 RepID=A0A3B3RT86_9TELE
GRPAFDIPRTAVEHHVLCGLKATEIFGVSVRTIRRRMDQNSLRQTDLYSSIADEELDRIVTEVHRSHPNTGYKLMHGHLKARGVLVPISRLRESLRKVDAEGVHMRRLRLYSVPGPNHLWHIDGNHKLIRFVVHGRVDRFSRLVVYLTVAGNNRASTVLQRECRCCRIHDQEQRGAQTFAYYCTSAWQPAFGYVTDNLTPCQFHPVHRIERMWRDVYEHVLDLFYQIFVSLEDQGTLNPDNEVHLYTLHQIFLPQIPKHLDSFRAAWNCQSPQQLWTRYREPAPVLEPVEVTLNTVSVPETQLSSQMKRLLLCQFLEYL